MTLITSGVISAPTAFIELALPAGYVEFMLKFWGCVSDSVEEFSDSFTYQLSFDNGVTYVDEGYECITNSFFSGVIVVNPDDTPTVSGSDTVTGKIRRSLDSEELAYVSANPKVSKPFYAEMLLYPGSASEDPRSVSRDIGISRSFSGTTDYRFQEGTDAVLTGVLARANKIKLGYYFGDGFNWAAGSYALYGTPQPS